MTEFDITTYFFSNPIHNTYFETFSLVDLILGKTINLMVIIGKCIVGYNKFHAESPSEIFVIDNF